MPEIEEYVYLGRELGEILVGDTVKYKGDSGSSELRYKLMEPTVVTALVPGYSSPVVKVEVAGNMLFWAHDFELVKEVGDAGN